MMKPMKALKKLFKSLKNRHQNNLKSKRGSEFVFDYARLLYYKCYKINPNSEGSDTDISY